MNGQKWKVVKVQSGKVLCHKLLYMFLKGLVEPIVHLSDFYIQGIADLCSIGYPWNDNEH